MRALIGSLALLTGIGFAEPDSLFDGETLNGWRVDGAAYWRVVGDSIVGQSDACKKNSVLWTEKQFSDFTFTCEFRFGGDIDSGIFLRQENDQIQIGASRSLKRDMTGSPYIANKRGYPKEAEHVAEVLKAGDWNRMKITAMGDTYTVILNGTEVMSYRSDSAVPKGPIGLQVHPGVVMKIEFRDLEIDSVDD